MGITRDEKKLKNGLHKLAQWQNKNAPLKLSTLEAKDDLTSIYRYQTYLLAKLGTGMVQSALLRKESRGAHFRLDYREIDPQYQRPTIIEYSEP